MEEGPSNTELPWGHYQELDLGTVEKRQNNCLNKKDSSAKDKADRGEHREERQYNAYAHITACT